MSLSVLNMLGGGGGTKIANGVTRDCYAYDEAIEPNCFVEELPEWSVEQVNSGISGISRFGGCKIDDNRILLFQINGTSTSSYVYATIAHISDNGKITYGTAVQLGTHFVGNARAVKINDTTCLIAGRCNSSDYSKVILVTIDGFEITLKASVLEFNYQYSGTYSCLCLIDETHVLYAYSSASYAYLNASVITIDTANYTLSKGSNVQLSTETYSMETQFASATKVSDRIFAIVHKAPTNQYIAITTAYVSGATITKKAYTYKAQQYSAAWSYSFLMANGNLGIFSPIGTSNYYLGFRIYTIDASSGAITEVSASNIFEIKYSGSSPTSIYYDETTQNIHIFYRDNGYDAKSFKYCICSISDNSISISSVTDSNISLDYGASMTWIPAFLINGSLFAIVNINNLAHIMSYIDTPRVKLPENSINGVSASKLTTSSVGSVYFLNSNEEA